VHIVGFYYKNISQCTVLWISNTEILLILKEHCRVKYGCMYSIWYYCVRYSITYFSFLICLCSMIMASMQAETCSWICDVISYDFIFTFSASCNVIHTRARARKTNGMNHLKGVSLSRRKLVSFSERMVLYGIVSYSSYVGHSVFFFHELWVPVTTARRLQHGG
jgi:hypothetical protein